MAVKRCKGHTVINVAPKLLDDCTSLVYAMTSMPADSACSRCCCAERSDKATNCMLNDNADIAFPVAGVLLIPAATAI
jgi:hypothetical protein